MLLVIAGMKGVRRYSLKLRVLEIHKRDHVSKFKAWLPPGMSSEMVQEATKTSQAVGRGHVESVTLSASFI